MHTATLTILPLQRPFPTSGFSIFLVLLPGERLFFDVSTMAYFAITDALIMAIAVDDLSEDSALEVLRFESDEVVGLPFFCSLSFNVCINVIVKHCPKTSIMERKTLTLNG